jgi:hypothetical protein
MSEPIRDHASITFNQDGIRGLGSALMNAQTYELFVDGQQVGILDGYRSTKDCMALPGSHSVYVRAYARDSASITRIYGYSQTLEINLAAGEQKRLACGLMPGPPLRKYLIFGGLLITLLLLSGLGPIGNIPLHTRYVLVMVMALVTMACSWYGHSSKPGANIYLKEA